MKAHWQKAYADHRWLLAISAVFIISILAEALAVGVPPASLLKIFGYLLMSLLIGLVVLTFIYLGAFCRFFMQSAAPALPARWRDASHQLDVAARDYLEGERWSYACLAFLVLLPNNFFFIAKSLVPIVNPYLNMKWDIAFQQWEKAAHFGHMPQEFVIPLVNRLGLAHVIDVAYAFWLVVMFIFVGYNTFVDRLVHRRLQFLWVFLLSWILLGSWLATYLSSVGPLFFHDFYPAEIDPYASVVANLEDIGRNSFFFATQTRALLLGWAHNGEFFNPNRIAAMPSMHVAIAWLWVLYAARINKFLCIAAAIFCGLVFVATIYFGIHYALDAYLSLLIVTPLWWLTGKLLARHHSRQEKLGAPV